MGWMSKAAVVLLLAAAVAGVFYLKQANNPQAEAGPDSAAAAPAKSLPRLLDLGADKCIPCKKMAVILDELKQGYAEQFEVVFIDVWKNPDAANPYNINLIPTQIFFDADGKELFRHEGFFPKEDILAKWKELGVDVSTADTKKAP